MDGCLVHCRMFFSIPDLYLLDTISNMFYCQMSLLGRARSPPGENHWCILLCLRALVWNLTNLSSTIRSATSYHWPGKVSWTVKCWSKKKKKHNLCWGIIDLQCCAKLRPTAWNVDFGMVYLLGFLERWENTMHLTWWFIHNKNSVKEIIVINSKYAIIPKS